MSANTNLGSTPVNQGYVQLIHTGETGGISGTLRTLYDGDGTASDLQIATNAVKIATELFIGSKTLSLFIQDTVGAMFSGNTETNISVTYQTSDNTIDLVATGAIASLTGGTGIDITGSGNLTVAIDSSVATQSYVNTQVAGIVDSAPGTLDTLNELAAALGDDPNFATTTATSLGNRLRIDTASQGLTSTQKTNALTNLGITSTSAEINVLDGYTGSVTELNYLDTLHATGVTNTEFDYLDGVTSNIQTQLNNKQASDPVLDDISGIDISSLGLNDTDKFIAFSGSSASFVLSSAPATQMSGSTNNGLLTYNSASFASVESNLTFDGSTGLLLLNQDSNAEAFRVTGGGGGNKIASFIRDEGVASPYAETYIHAGSGDPQITFRDVGNKYFSIGIDDSANAFKISDNSAVGTNDRLTIDTSGNVGIGVSPSALLDVNGTGYIRTAVFSDAFKPYSGTLATYGSSSSTDHYFVGDVGIGIQTPSNKLEAYGIDAGLVVHYQGQSRGGIHAPSTQRIALATTASADDLVFGYGSSPVTSA